MAYGRRRRHSRRRYALRRLRYRRRYRFRRNRHTRNRGTRSAVIKLSATISFQVAIQYGTTAVPVMRYFPITFDPGSFPGFTEYTQVYTQYRVLYCKAVVTRPKTIDQCTCYDARGERLDSNCQTSYQSRLLVVPSRSFAQYLVLPDPNDQAQEQNPRFQVRSEIGGLFQSRYHKLLAPPVTRTSFRFSFIPYYVSLYPTQGGSSSNIVENARPAAVQRPISCRRWLPFNATEFALYGPFLAPLENDNTPMIDVDRSSTTSPVYLTHLDCFVTVYLQFKGQR